VTFVGRILIVITLVMSILFASLAVVVFATHTNWRSRAADLEKKVSSLELANRQIQQDMAATQEQIAREQAARRFEVAILHTQVDQSEAQLQQSEALLATEQSNHSTLQESAKVAVNELARLTTEVGGLRNDLRQNREARDVKHEQLVAQVDETNALQGQKNNLEERNLALAEQVARFKRVADAAGITEFDNIENVPPSVDGVVMAVGRSNLLEISIGSDDGLKEGHTLDVFRDGTYLGRVVVRKASPDRSVVEIMPEYRKGLIKKGDRVATRIVS
jgi:septal ring factor EnvC (AmiA/AmiB activator)